MSQRRICEACGNAVPWPSGFPSHETRFCTDCNVSDDQDARLDLLFVATGLALLLVLGACVLAWWGLR